MNNIKRLLIITFCFIAASQLLSPLIVLADASSGDNPSKPTMAPFFWVIAIVGGSIAITLTYVSWRKYKAEKRKQSDNDSNS